MPSGPRAASARPCRRQTFVIPPPPNPQSQVERKGRRRKENREKHRYAPPRRRAQRPHMKIKPSSPSCVVPAQIQRPRWCHPPSHILGCLNGAWAVHPCSWRLCLVLASCFPSALGAFLPSVYGAIGSIPWMVPCFTPAGGQAWVVPHTWVQSRQHKPLCTAVAFPFLLQ